MVFIWLFSRLRGRVVPQKAVHDIATRWGRSILNGVPGWKVEIEGKENLPSEETPYVLVANHESATDILAIYFLGIQFRWLSKDSMFRLPLIGTAMRWAGYVSIKRGQRDSHLEALRISEEYVKSGIPMLYFPEGTRSVLGRPGEFKTGAFRLAQSCNAPVLPVVLYGAGKLLRKRSISPNPATVKVCILPLMESFPEEAPQEFTNRVQRKISLVHKLLVDGKSGLAGGMCESKETVCSDHSGFSG